MKKKLELVIPLMIIILIVPVFIYLINFKNGISTENCDWGNFGDYLSGTIGVLFSFFSIFLIYLTFTEQRNQQYEYVFNQILSDYSSILNLIKERWLQTTSDANGNPIYQNGREIFGNAVGYIDIQNSKEKFIEIFSIHINVFDHYFNFIINSILSIFNDTQLKDECKNDYLKRISSQFSFYELVFFGYYILYLNKNEVIKKIYKEYFLTRLKEFENNSQITHIDKVCYLIVNIK